MEVKGYEEKKETTIKKAVEIRKIEYYYAKMMRIFKRYFIQMAPPVILIENKKTNMIANLAMFDVSFGSKYVSSKDGRKVIKKIIKSGIAFLTQYVTFVKENKLKISEIQEFKGFAGADSRVMKNTVFIECKKNNIDVILEHMQPGQVDLTPSKRDKILQTHMKTINRDIITSREERKVKKAKKKNQPLIKIQTTDNDNPFELFIKRFDSSSQFLLHEDKDTYHEYVRKCCLWYFIHFPEYFVEKQNGVYICKAIFLGESFTSKYLYSAADSMEDVAKPILGHIKELFIANNLQKSCYMYEFLEACKFIKSSESTVPVKNNAVKFEQNNQKPTERCDSKARLPNFRSGVEAASTCKHTTNDISSGSDENPERIHESLTDYKNKSNKNMNTSSSKHKIAQNKTIDSVGMLSSFDEKIQDNEYSSDSYEYSNNDEQFELPEEYPRDTVDIVAKEPIISNEKRPGASSPDLFELGTKFIGNISKKRLDHGVDATNNYYFNDIFDSEN